MRSGNYCCCCYVAVNLLSLWSEAEELDEEKEDEEGQENKESAGFLFSSQKQGKSIT